jgi:hypothetical protein
MMPERMALKTAIDLLLVPSQVRIVRAQPLPEGVESLLRIAAGEAEAESAAAAAAGRPVAVVRRAATFFIEQILFAPDADSYQVLGASREASASELRRNIALLLRWLHPDLDPAGERSLFVSRVTAAWNDLKTPERRAAYDATRRCRRNGSASHAKGGRTGSARRQNRKFLSKENVKSARVIRRRQARGILSRALLALLHPTWRY